MSGPLLGYDSLPDWLPRTPELASRRGQPLNFDDEPPLPRPPPRAAMDTAAFVRRLPTSPTLTARQARMERRFPGFNRLK